MKLNSTTFILFNYFCYATSSDEKNLNFASLCRNVNLSVPFNISVALLCALSTLFICYLIFAVLPKRSKEKMQEEKKTPSA